MEIHVAEITDALEILSLQKFAYLSEAKIYNDYSLPPLTQTVAELAAEFDRKTILKAVSGGLIVGSVNGFMVEGCCHIGRLMVHPALQGRGIGTRLMHAIEEIFADADSWEVFTGELSIRNIRLYKKLGYRVERKERFAGNRFAVVFMRKKRHIA
jgi:ribosomal protein S18 acetylase RimI-like enzyme